jgi:peptidylprolyl isomerase
MKLFLVIALIGATVLVAGCGGKGDSTSANETSASQVATTSTPDEPDAEIAASDWSALKKVAGSYSKRLIIPSGPPPKKIVINDLRVGKGRKLEPERIFTVKYVALDYTTGDAEQESLELPFEASWRNAEPELVDSFEVGLKGMRVGGIREMIAPSYLVYNKGALVYWIKLLKIGRKGWD